MCMCSLTMQRMCICQRIKRHRRLLLETVLSVARTEKIHMGNKSAANYFYF